MSDDILEHGLDKKKSPEQLDLELDYRLLFRSARGTRVLTDILMNMCWFGAQLTGDDIMAGERNVGISILGRLGHGMEDSEGVIKSIVNVPITGEVI